MTTMPMATAAAIPVAAAAPVRRAAARATAGVQRRRVVKKHIQQKYMLCGFAIHAFLATPAYLYGNVVESDKDLVLRIWPAIVYQATGELCRSIMEHLDTEYSGRARETVQYRRIFLLATLITCVSLMISGIFFSSAWVVVTTTTQTVAIVFYGFFAGIGASLYMWKTHVILEAVRPREDKFVRKTIQLCGEAFCQLFLSFVFTSLRTLYGTAQSIVLMSAMLVNLIPLSLIITKHREDAFTTKRISVIKAEPGFGALPLRAALAAIFVADQMDGLDTPMSWRNPATEMTNTAPAAAVAAAVVDTHSNYMLATDEAYVTYVNPNGVEIMEIIPEEDETVSIMRSSNATIDNYSITQSQMLHKSHSNGRLYAQSPPNTTDTGRSSPLPEAYANLHRIRRMSLAVTSHLWWNMLDKIVMPLQQALFVPQLYATTLLISTDIFSYVMCLTVLPGLAVSHHALKNAEIPFLFSLLAFPWMCFSLMTPRFGSSLYKRKIQWYTLGSICKCLALIFISFSTSKLLLSVSAVLLGFGQVVTAFLQEIVFQLGMTRANWTAIRRPVHFTNGLLILIWGVLAHWVVVHYSFQATVGLAVHTALHTVGSVQKTSNILPSQGTVAAIGANWNSERGLLLNGVGLDTASSVTNGVGFSPAYETENKAHFELTPKQQEQEPKETVLEQDTTVGDKFSAHTEAKSDPRLEAVQRTLDFIANTCKERQVDNLWGVLLLQRKLGDVREYLLRISTEAEAQTAGEAACLLGEIDSKIKGLLSKIERTHNANLDPMGFDLFNRIRHWFLLGGRNNNRDPPNTEVPDSERNRKRSCQVLVDEVAAPPIKYRRVDNSFPKVMPNDGNDYYNMANTNQNKEQGKSNNHNAHQQPKRNSMFCTPQMRQVRVKNTQATTPVVLSDSDDEQWPNERSLYQAFADRLDSSSKPVSRPETFGRSSSKKQFLLYSDAVRYGANGFGNEIYDQRPASSLSSSEARLNGHGSTLYDPTVNKSNILSVEEHRNEHNQYINLISNLTFNERECPRRSVLSRQTEKPPPPPLLQPINQNNSNWLRVLVKNNAESGIPTHSDYAKLISYNSKQQHQRPLNLDPVRKPPPALIQCDRRYGGSSSVKTKTEKPVSVIESLIDEPKKKANDTQVKTPQPPPTSETMMLRTKALQMQHSKSIYFADNYEDIFKKKCERIQQEVNHTKSIVLQEAEKTSEARRAFEQGLRESLFKRRFMSQTLFVVEKYSLDDSSEPEFIPFTDAHQQRYNELIYGKGDQLLISKFSLSITRNDIRTLAGSSWLNDEVINFYMNLLMDRAQRKEGKLPSVYAMNTFFVPRLLQGGYGNVKRWTRKVDIFSKDIIPVPVHVSNVHWCMAIIHMKNKTIRYYDSMGKPNSEVLSALENYLLQESLDKRKKPFDTSDFIIENVQNVPHQTNGSDCGVFSCMFAEYITRNKPLTFSQEHMEYFRKKMVLEICGGELWL